MVVFVKTTTLAREARDAIDEVARHARSKPSPTRQQPHTAWLARQIAACPAELPAPASATS
jgi:hypothetical protein